MLAVASSAPSQRAVCTSRWICFTYLACAAHDSLWKFPHLRASDCDSVNLPISARIRNKRVKVPSQDTIAALWACNVRPSIGTHRTIGALEGKNTTTTLIACQSLGIVEKPGSNRLLGDRCRTENVLLIHA